MEDKMKNAYERAAGYSYAEEGDAVPNTESPPEILARHAQMHHSIGLRLRQQALDMLDTSMKHFAAASDCAHARSRILD